MKDRIPTQVLPNGAIRQEIFDENGVSKGHQWVKRADEPVEVGTPINKASLLKDTTAMKHGLDPDTAVPDDVFQLFAGIYFEQIGYADFANKSEFIVEIDGVLTDYAEIIIAGFGMSALGGVAPSIPVFPDVSKNERYGTLRDSNSFFHMRRLYLPDQTERYIGRGKSH